MSELSYLEKLLDGVKVEWKALADVVEFRRGSFPQPYGNSDWFDGEGSMPFVQVADVSDEGYRLNEETKQLISKLAQPKSVFVETGTVIVTLQGTLGRVAITQYDCYVDRTLAIFTNYKESINKKYFAYQLKSKFDVEKKNARGSTLKTITKQEFSKFRIAIPSLEVQNEIVRILDTFTTLTAELTAELITRKQQYSYYRKQLLTFNKNEVEWKVLEKAVKLQRGKRLVRSQLEEFGDYAVYQNSMTPLGYYHESNVKSNTTFIISAGAAGEIGYSNIDFWAADDVYFLMTPDNIEDKFLYYFLLIEQYKILTQVRRASIPRLSRNVIEKLEIPIPPLAEQQRIVTILDKFNALTTSLTEGLPREIQLRQQQYEYYRELLLSFPKVEDNV